MKLLKNRKGSILILSIMMLFILLTLTLLMFTQEFVSKNSAVRSRMSTTQAQTIEVTLQRFSDTLSAKSESGKKLPIPPPSQSSGSPTYDLPFECSNDDTTGFKVSGRWKKDNSIYYPPQQNAGRDFTNVPEAGYYSKIAAPGYDKTNVPPWYNLVVINTPLKARYVASFAYHFPYGAFAPNGKINLKDAYGFTNPLNDNGKNGDYYSGIPVDMYARKNIDVEEYPYGKAYSENGAINVGEKSGVLKFTFITENQSDEAKKYVAIIRKQLDTLSDSIVKVTLNKDKVIFGRKITDVTTFATRSPGDDLITLEQSTDFPFSGMTVNSNNPKEKTMGNYYGFMLHPPIPPDISEIFSIDFSNATDAYSLLDDVMKIFNGYKIMWKIIPTDMCLITADIMLGKDIAQTSIKLAAAIAAGKFLKIAYYSAKLAKYVYNLSQITRFTKYYYMMQSYESRLFEHSKGSVRNEPQTTEEDERYSNSGWQYVRVCSSDNINTIANILHKSGSGKYKNLGLEMAKRTATLVRLSHFGNGDFTSNWRKINTADFIYSGTFVVPRGRTLNFPRNMTIEGDLWIQDGASFYVGGNLKLKVPSKPSQLPDMVKSSGRLFLGKGSSIIVEKDFECGGSIPLGSIVLNSPNQKINDITSVIYSKTGSVSIPYGIMPGISVDELAKLSRSSLPSSFAEGLKALIDNSANISKVSGPFHFRKAFFSSYASNILLFRHKNLDNLINQSGFRPIVMPFKQQKANFLCAFFPIFTESFTYVMNAYLGENTPTNSDWWIFGYGVIPILPKMDTGTIAENMSVLKDISAALEQLKSFNNDITSVLATDAPINLLDSARNALDGCASVYAVFYSGSFGPGCDDKANNLTRQIIQTTQQAYKPFGQIITNMDRAKDTLTSASRLFISFYGNTYPSIKSHLPGGDDQKAFIECPGILIYAEKDINMGTKEKLLPQTVFPASGLFIANRDIEIKSRFRVVGCLISLSGNISANDTHLRYYPYFSQASIYIPKDVGGDLNENLKLVSDNDLKSNNDPCNVGITIPRIFSEGWEFYSEYYNYRPFKK